MRILLVGDYSNVHATLAEGLRALGHFVTVASDGDGWKNYPRDIDLARRDSRAASAQTSAGHPVGGNFSRLTYYLRLCRTFRQFRGYDVVQLINPIFLPLRAERIWPFYRYLRRHLALHPDEILRLKAESQAYVSLHHDHLKVAKQYIAAWQGK